MTTETMSRKFTLPISPEYVAHWGLWEAVREIYQNALDEEIESQCTASMTWANDILRISTSRGALSPESLVLGRTSKRDDPRLRGKFGEGYKLALLVLARMGHDVAVVNGSELWLPRLEHDDAFNSTVLTICVDVSEESHEGVEFIIHNVTCEDWKAIQDNVRPNGYEGILDAPGQKGRVYVGGLYVSTVKGFECGYAFPPGQIKLDRDRGMVDGFDLSWETSRLWTIRGGKRATELMEAEALDVAHVEYHASASSRIATYSLGYFTRRYGANAVPVSSQDEIERAAQAGMKWVLVPEKVKTVLRMVKSWFIPTTKSALDQLKEFRSKWKWRMDSQMRADLDGIICSMDPQEAEAPKEIEADIPF